MKFMVQWVMSPDHQPKAADRFLSDGAPMPDGVTMLGRWHAPGSSRGFLLVETDNLTALATHAAEWNDLLTISDVVPVLEDAEAGAAIAAGTNRG